MKEEMDIDRAIKIGGAILGRTYGEEECEALDLLLYYAQAYKDHLIESGLLPDD